MAKRPSHPGHVAWKRRIFFGRDPGNGEPGCVLAHRNACEHIVGSAYDTAPVPEDDALLTDELPALPDELLASRERRDQARFPDRMARAGRGPRR